MTVLTSKRTARKAHKCDRCGGVIQPGETYKVHAATPRDGDLGNDVWWTSKEHIDLQICYGETTP